MSRSIPADSSRPRRGDRRRLADRRSRPTPALSALAWGGRRAGFRRAGEGVGAYVDRPRLVVTLVVLFVTLSSSLDALFTLLHLQQGAAEANPVMREVLSYGSTSFVLVKMALTAAGCLLLALHQFFPLGLAALRTLAITYLGLLVYHASLFVARG